MKKKMQVMIRMPVILRMLCAALLHGRTTVLGVCGVEEGDHSDSSSDH
jgi:hypothetical protein